MQNYDNVVARRFFTRGAGHLHQRIVDINVFYKRQSQELVYTIVRVSVLGLLLDNTRTNRRTHILEDLKY